MLRLTHICHLIRVGWINMCCLLVLLGCEQSTSSDHAGRDYLVLGHTYQWSAHGSKIDKRLESVNYSAFRGLWLGGDLCSETTKEKSTLDYLDGIFGLRSPETLWAVGNHDIRNGNLNYIQDKTGRPLFFVHRIGRIKILVINTMTEHPAVSGDCDWRKDQADFIHRELDGSLTGDDLASTLVFFGHAAVWSDSEEILRTYERIGNQGASWFNFYCDRPSPFRTEFFPKLRAIQEAGTQVICLAGDGGQYDKTFFKTGKSGIQYYVTGINNSVLDTDNMELIDQYNTAPDSVLIFHHDTLTHSLTGEFIPIENL